MKMTIPIEGMHCRACEITIGQHLEKVPRVTKVSVSLRTETATIEAASPPSHAELLKAVNAAGYNIGDAKQPWISRNPADYRELCVGILIIGTLAILYNVLGINKIISTGSISSGGIGVALLTGLAAGVSTCMAVVGGLVLSLSARHAKKHPNATTMQKFRPHLFFNISRIVSFFLLGGLIGALGASIQLQGATLGVLMIIVGIVMFGLGLQLTNVMPRLNTGGLTLPPGVAKFLGLKKHTEKEYNHSSAIALGAISFFLPCGFTQVMQLYAISTGSFVTGSLVMGVFAIGTAPGLLSVGGLTSVIKGKKASGRFFKIAGVAVIAMAMINISSGYNLTGFQVPTFSTNSAVNTSDANTQTLNTIYTLSKDIIPADFTLKPQTSYKLIVDSKDDGQGCMSTIMIPGLFETPLLLEKGKKQVLSFVTKNPGTYKITCAMGLPRGTITVVS
ncbi:sulfite exporter TauE/SafE family protein [Candidatus Saccharibacteria bacterium]|nr:sulfite exporter TauE/SafE family protein [Candidatus Saccharibacteria bacterium]